MSEMVFNNGYAGLSGPAIKPIALRMVHQVCKAVKIPVMGLGGITTWEDAIEFIMAGAQVIQVGTATFMKPDISLDIIEGMEKYMEETRPDIVVVMYNPKAITAPVGYHADLFDFQ